MQFTKSTVASLCATLALVTAPHAVRAATFFGPTPYLDASNSPFDSAAPAFLLEDFEDSALSIAGVTASAGAPLAPGGDTDSVDGDDGLVDGLGRAGHSFFSNDGPTGIRFTFDSLLLGGLPGEVGIVWTDGAGDVTFEAFDADGLSLGVIGPVALGDGATDGATPEDRFFGVAGAPVSAIRIANTSGGIEVDHLQLGAFNQPPDCAEAFGTPALLWPPNHKFASVAVLGVTDPDGDLVTITVIGVGQDEPVDDAGDGSTCPDALGVGTDTAQIRVERAGPGDGRVYAIDFLADDGRGGACEGVVTVCVPHDQGHGDVCGDQGALADSTGLACVADCDPDAGGECEPGECAGEQIPRRVTQRLGKAGRLLDVAAERGKAGAARKAVRLLASAERKLAKLDQHDRVSDECTDAFVDRVHMSARRAERWLDDHKR
jgi:hypothetical protein